MNNYINVLKKYAVFAGRARRKEYWMFVLVNIIFVILLDIIIALLSKGGVQFLSGLVGVVYIVYCIGIIIPSIAVAVRRLHDTDRSGWWYFISFIPIVGTIIMLVFLCLDSTPGDNRFGSNPKGSIVPQSPQPVV